MIPIEEVITAVLDNPTPSPLITSAKALGKLASSLTLAADAIIYSATAVAATSNVVVGGKAVLFYLVNGPSNLVATGGFTMSLICSVAGVSSTGVQLALKAGYFS